MMSSYVIAIPWQNLSRATPPVAGADISPTYGDLVAYETAFFLRRTLVEPDRQRIASETPSFAELSARLQPAVAAVNILP
jgi:hypothetical protein